MSHNVFASITVPLPDDPVEMAARLAQISAEWARLLQTIGQPAVAQFSLLEQRRTGRRPKLVERPGDLAS